MKNTALFFLITVFLFSCKSNKNIPDVSGIKVDVPIERFDKSFFSIDTNQLQTGLLKLQQEHAGFYADFMTELLGVSGAITDDKTLQVCRQFISGYKPVFDSLKDKFNNTDKLKKEIEKGFQFVKYYFPSYKIGKAFLYLGPFDAPGVATTNGGLAIGIQQFAGGNFSIYQTEPIQRMFPSYIVRRFSPEYIPVNSMKAVVAELFPDKSGSKPLIEQMVEKGKQWFLLDKFAPTTDDTLKTGYTKQQLAWCIENEGLIWSNLIKNEDLQSLTPTVIQTYIGEAPFTQGFPQEFSPGNIGQWIGWQIVKKYAEKNSTLTPEDIMRTPSIKIIEDAKYKPK